MQFPERIEAAKDLEAMEGVEAKTAVQLFEAYTRGRSDAANGDDDPEQLITSLRSQLASAKEDAQLAKTETQKLNETIRSLRKERTSLKDQLRKADPDGLLDQLKRSKQGMETLMGQLDQARKLNRVLADKSHDLDPDDELRLLRHQVLSLTKENDHLRHAAAAAVDKAAKAATEAQERVLEADARVRDLEDQIRILRAPRTQEQLEDESKFAFLKRRFKEVSTEKVKAAEEASRIVSKLEKRIFDLDQVVAGRLGKKVKFNEMTRSTCCRCGVKKVRGPQIIESREHFKYTLCETCAQEGYKALGIDPDQKKPVAKEKAKSFNDVAEA